MISDKSKCCPLYISDSNSPTTLLPFLQVQKNTQSVPTIVPQQDFFIFPAMFSQQDDISAPAWVEWGGGGDFGRH